MILLSFFFFIIGLIAPIILFVLVFVLLCVYTSYFRKKERNNKNIEFQKRGFSYATKTTIQWLNSLLSKSYPQIVTPEFIRYLINIQTPKLVERTPIETITIENISMLGKQPVIKHARLNTSMDSDYVALSFKFYPSLTIDADSVVKTKYWKSFSVGLKFSLDSLEGGINIQIPKVSGKAKILISDETSIQMDINANVANMVTIKTDVIGLLGDSITSAINSIIRGTIITIPLEQWLFKKNKKKEKKVKVIKTHWSIKKYSLFSNDLIIY